MWVVSERFPDRALLDLLRLRGYEVRLEPCVGSALGALRRGPQPELVVVGHIESADDLAALRAELSCRAIREVFVAESRAAIERARPYSVQRHPLPAPCTQPEVARLSA